VLPNTTLPLKRPPVGFAVVKVKLLVAAVPPTESVASTVMVDDATAVGTPLITPVDVLRLKPAGSVPTLTL
jgi:hypothetical protein